jgi:uncharacterized membrane protein
MEYTSPQKYKIYRSKKHKLKIRKKGLEDEEKYGDERKIDNEEKIESEEKEEPSIVEIKQYVAHNKQSCDEVKEKFKYMSQAVVNRGKVGFTVFASSLIIGAILTVLFIPCVYQKICILIPGVYYRLFVIFIFFVAIVYLVERFFLMLNS